MPLDYLLGIMRDEDQDARWRLDAAKAAAPYCHARLSASTDAPAVPRNGKPPFDRRSYHARYMRTWRKRQAAAKGALRGDGEG